MEKLVLDISVQGLTPDYLEQAHRYVLIGPNRLAYLITDQLHRVAVVKSWEINANSLPAEQYLRRVLDDDAILAHNFAQTTIGIQNNLHVVTPNRMFDPTRLPSYFQLLTAFGKSHHFAFDDLPVSDAKLVYALEPELKALIDEKLPGARMAHATTALIEAYRSICNASTYNVFVHVFGHQMQVFVFDGTDILFFNTFRFSSSSDFVYFALLPMKQLQIDPAQVSPVISGEIPETSDALTTLRRFTGPLRFTQLPQVFEYPGAVRSLPSHFCFDLLALKLKK